MARTIRGRDDVLGKTIQLDGRTYTIIGVMPPGFKMPNEATPDVVLALRTQPESERRRTELHRARAIAPRRCRKPG